MAMVVGPAAILFPIGLIVLFALNGWTRHGFFLRLWYTYWGLVLFSLLMLCIARIREGKNGDA